MTRAALKSIGTAALVVVLAGMAFGLVFFALVRLWPHRDVTPVVIARQDEKTAATASVATGAAVQSANDDATLHLDVTTKEIRDAFSTIPAPAPQPVAGVPQPLPAAPVDRVRDSLNESIARANRAARPADAAE